MEQLNVGKELAALERLTVRQLRQQYAEVFGEPTSSRHKDHLIKRIVWRLQALAQGGLSERARARATELANDADLRMLPPREQPTGSAGALTAVGKLAVQQDDRPLMPGTLLTRPYKDRTVRVLVLDGGFEYEGKVYRSLSAIAKVVTGSHWSGNHFFGIAKEGHE
jgi:hypothetical protein